MRCLRCGEDIPPASLRGWWCMRCGFRWEVGAATILEGAMRYGESPRGNWRHVPRGYLAVFAWGE